MIVAQCGLYTTSVTVTAVSSADGSQETIANFPIEGANVEVYCGEAPIQRQVFDKSYTRLAVSWTDARTSARHVGWMTTQGEIVDITEAISGPAGFSKGPQHSNPRFDPFTDQFFYIDETARKAVWVDTNTHKIAKQVSLDGVYSDETYFIGAKGQVESVSYLPSQILLAPGGGQGQIAGLDKFVGWLPPNKMLYIDWLKNQIALQPAVLFDDCPQASCVTYITPETNYKLTSGVFNAGSGKIAFLGTLNGDSTYHLFISNVDGSGEPKEIASLIRKDDDGPILLELTDDA